MEKVAFIGSYDKTDLMIYVAKLLNILGKKVLVVDATALQKTRYIIPKIKAAKQYITTFETIDVAIGFESLEQIKKYKQTSDDEDIEKNFNYDIALINVDSYKGYCNFKIKTEDKKFFVTSFDIYCLKRGLQVFKKMEEQIEVQKVIFSKDMLEEEDQYINYLSRGLKIKWKEDIIFFPFENGDQTAIFTNQRSERIQIKGLSGQYIDGLLYITEEVSGAKSGDVKKAIKALERV